MYRTKSLVKTTPTKTRKLCEARAGWSESLSPAWSTREIQVSQRYMEKPCLKTINLKTRMWWDTTVVPFLTKLKKEDYDEFKACPAT